MSPDPSTATTSNVPGWENSSLSSASWASRSRNGLRTAGSRSAPYVSAQLRTLMSLTGSRSAAVASRTENPELTVQDVSQAPDWLPAGSEYDAVRSGPLGGDDPARGCPLNSSALARLQEGRNSCTGLFLNLDP